jgi:hypothetical protein
LSGYFSTHLSIDITEQLYRSVDSQLGPLVELLIKYTIPSLSENNALNIHPFQQESLHFKALEATQMFEFFLLFPLQK